MAEEINTGGLVKFRYGKGEQSTLSEKQKKEIRGAYAAADERKMREKRNRIIFWIIGILIGIGILGLVLWGVLGRQV